MPQRVARPQLVAQGVDPLALLVAGRGAEDVARGVGHVELEALAALVVRGLEVPQELAVERLDAEHVVDGEVGVGLAAVAGEVLRAEEGEVLGVEHGVAVVKVGDALAGGGGELALDLQQALQQRPPRAADADGGELAGARPVVPVPLGCALHLGSGRRVQCRAFPGRCNLVQLLGHLLRLRHRHGLRLHFIIVPDHADARAVLRRAGGVGRERGLWRAAVARAASPPAAGHEP